ncbi:hypothetical protein [Phaeocystidibacter luteus]|uniref:Outer membrane beta-barrel protein n=1 Tax=Phaeocystidibacter luteus TaxID=911197 RepID=A0A6N6RJ88_9FLAO|nr:hypothetical protein [Phaeocystidibacter luteus]KAB2814056.1 hypothetical protein F8C67_05075 [Phaeocystidibacter luteus]
MISRLWVVLTFCMVSFATYSQTLSFAMSAGYDDFYDAPHVGIGVYLDGSIVQMDFGLGENQTILGVDTYFNVYRITDGFNLMLGLGAGTSIWDNDGPAGANELYAKGNVALNLRPFFITYGYGLVFPNEFSPFESGGMNHFGLIVTL